MRARTMAAAATVATAGILMAGVAPALASEANAPPTAEELMARPWFVKQDGVWYKYAKHNWYEQRREAEYRYFRTVEHPAETTTIHHDAISHVEYRYEIEQPYYTIEHKQIQAAGNTAVLTWLGQIGATDMGAGWWHIPDEVIARVDNFNPVTVANTGTVNLAAYGGPNMTVQYRKTQEISLTPGTFSIEQTGMPLYWNGREWVADQSAAAWVTEAPDGGTVFQSRTVVDQPAWDETVTTKEAWTETQYAAADGATTDASAAVWLSKAPDGDWQPYGELRYPDWNDDDPWYQVVGYDWALGKDPGPQPDYYDGYTAMTQRFRPEIKKWKVKLDDPAPEEPVTPTTPAQPGHSAKAKAPAAPTTPTAPAAEQAQEPVVDATPGDPAEIATLAPAAPGEVADALDAGGPLAIEAGGDVSATAAHLPARAALIAGGVLVVGGIGVTYGVVRHDPQKR